jgi:hypothetical protein
MWGYYIKNIHQKLSERHPTFSEPMQDENPLSKAQKKSADESGEILGPH